ncbi:MAG: DUF2207 domain-containing protein [Eggerthellaceae bacterium]|nr:DUF2207 domain-containing protein [Eggerthellaceae bacterium]
MEQEGASVVTRLASKAVSHAFPACISVWASACMLLALCAALLPQSAWASAEGVVTQASLSAHVDTNASLRVFEDLSVSFESPADSFKWMLDIPNDSHEVEIAGVRIALSTEDGDVVGDWVECEDYELVVAHPEQFKDENAEKPCRQYVLTVSGDFDASTYLAEVEVVVADGIQRYRDIGELYWRYIDEEQPTTLRDVFLRVLLPVSAEDVDDASSQVSAWGHGSSDGELSIGEDGVVSYAIPKTESGQYAEAHVVFPASWLPNVEVDSPSYHSESHLSSALSNEKGWADIAQAESIWLLRVRLMFGIILAAALVTCAAGILLTRKDEALMKTFAMRWSATVAVIAVGQHLFFKDGLTTLILLSVSVIVLLCAVTLSYNTQEHQEAKE